MDTLIKKLKASQSNHKAYLTSPLVVVDEVGYFLLVADDDPACLDVLVKMLAALGYSVFSAINGKEAVEAYAALKQQIDLVILDMKMPFNGENAFTKLRKIDNNAKILLITGFVENSKIGNLLEQGYSDFVQKPFNLNTLERKTTNILGQSI
jgi:CheY-like chemotaxis protein